jgi:hypothetical protein
MAHDDAHQELRRAVRAVLKDFSDTYWRALDQERAYPEAFVPGASRAWRDRLREDLDEGQREMDGHLGLRLLDRLHRRVPVRLVDPQ